MKLTDLEIDIRFLNDKYGISREVAIEIITDIVKGNFESDKQGQWDLRK